MKLKHVFVTLLIFYIFFFIVKCDKNDDNNIKKPLASTPPMGWNSWNAFGLNINEQLIKETTDMMIKEGLKDAGYNYVVMDDGWHGKRDENDYIQSDPTRFPSGIKSLADYVHSKKMKIGIYSDAGIKTCGGFPGSKGYEQLDANQYANWTIDYLKFDWCYTGKQDAIQTYNYMRSCLNNTKREILFSICEWGMSKPWLWAEGVGHIWRTTMDINDCWDCNNFGFPPIGWTTILDAQIDLYKYAGPGHWNDPDMLIVGIYGKSFLSGKGCTDGEYRAHFSLWCILAAPLMIGCDVRNMSAATKETLTNKEVIAVDQDSLGIQGTKVNDSGDLEVWAKPLSNNNIAVVLFNRSLKDLDITVNWNDIKLNANTSAKVRDLWLHSDLGSYTGQFTTNVKSHEIIMIKISP